jgi:hypothetical protein
MCVVALDETGVEVRTMVVIAFVQAAEPETEPSGNFFYDNETR